ncbi:helix-turn-helix domain-containing protein [Streptomyces nymphaeiformis]|jgi:DNA-binding CsgD family transcriptional regulator|uniref:DNA-binding CsgD family transcriptional regulator n=1 Tax=Streptomyces nymphaeiformis TaxID=2663842 RepID=A0A7W7U9S3_9ACTN|nr:helix-turn-helix domain-containing protein [Streptomyces nymphaeiformis]MBB4987478.1 DNA-binding CsgD family transcriptional regulator [Streptomyces nymphaeiformis]
MSTTIETRRATVARLHAEGHSYRQIADQVGVSKDTVARDVRDVEAATAQAAARLARRRLPRRARPARLRRPQAPRQRRTAPLPAPAPVRDTAHDTTPPPAPAAPCVALPLSVRLVADLATLTRNGVSPEAAILHAVGYMARAYRQGWEAGLYPRNVNPVLQRHQFAPYRPSEQAANTTT